MKKIIAPWHYATDKLSDRWCREVASSIYYNPNCENLLLGKDVNEIEQYATGDIDMTPYIKQFKSWERKYKKALTGEGYNKVLASLMESVNNAFVPLPLITVKLNSAVHLIFKTMFDIEIRAVDTLANDKRESDLEFLKKRQQIHNIMQDMADQLSQGNVDVGSTKHSADNYKEVPFDLDLNDPLQLKIFKEVVYKLQPEAAYEVILNLLYKLKKIDGVDLLETQDQFKFGVSCNRIINSAITDLPDVEYLDPGKCYAVKSKYQDFRDSTERYVRHTPTITDLHNIFGAEIGDKNALDYIINGSKGNGGYCSSNNISKISMDDWGSTTVELLEMQAISIEGISYVENKSGNKRFVPDGTPESKQIFGQNTYVFYWLPNTDYFFGKGILPWAYRKQGQEAFTKFSINFYKSQKKSAVEHCIGENKKAQIADIKLQHCILRAAPPGKFIDLKYIRKATEGLVFQGRTQKEVQEELLDMVIEDNIFIGDSGGFDGANEGQFKPVSEIAGGLKTEVNGYLSILQQSSANISRYTGWNDELSGLNSNPDLLNGARKLNISYGMNTINYAYVARVSQYTNVFEVLAYHVKAAIEKGGNSRKAIEQLINKDRVQMIDCMGTLKDHQFFVEVNLGMTDDQKQQVEENIQRMESKGQLTRLERFIINQARNYKEANLLLAAVENKANKAAAAQAQQGFQNQRQLQDDKTQGSIAVVQATSQGKQEQTYTQGEVASKLMELGHQLGLTEEQLRSVGKAQLQRDRLTAGFVKQDRAFQSKREEAETPEIKAIV